LLAQMCGLNEVYNDCGTACPDTCGTELEKSSGKLRYCNRMCVAGCFCADGYVRDAKRNNQCVLTRDR